MSYFLTGVLMSALPLALIAATGIWYSRKTRVAPGAPGATEAGSLPRMTAAAPDRTVAAVPPSPPAEVARPSI
jgi:hypothetical protein